MNRFLSSASLAISLIVSAATPISLLLATGTVYAAEDNSLYYNFGKQKISLYLKTDAIAVEMTKTRGGDSKKLSPLSQLQRDFKTRGGNQSASTTQIQPLNSKYALITTPNNARGGENLKKEAETKTYITATLPVLKIAGKSTSLVLPNEMIVSFKPGISDTERKAIFAQNNLESAKLLPFTKGFYSVIPAKAKGLAVLSVSNQLSKVKGIESSMPNFIEIKATPDLNSFGGSETSSAKITKVSNSSTIANNGRDVKTLQWHIDSQPMLKAMGLTGSRTDVHAPEAWGKGKKGEGVIVAVIDNLIQWDHPALVNSIMTVDCRSQKEAACLPGETHGWDFSDGEGGDNDTRINAEEIAALRPDLEESLQSDLYLQTKYAPGIAKLKVKKPELSDAQILAALREYLRSKSVSSFHGTMSTGMIVGSSRNGFQGIAPNVKILPVRAGGLGSSLTQKAVLISMAYAAVRGADVINMSFGSDLPSPAEASMIAQLQKEYPKLVFVAAAGNENTAELGYPASFPGVVSVGAISVKGNRASYSNFGSRIDVVAPGGDPDVDGGVLTLSGVGADGFWQNTPQPVDFAPFQDRRGYYIFTEGTSFASPAVVGVVALMKSADPQRKLTAKQYRDILIKTSSRESLSLTSKESADFAQAKQELGNRASDISAEQFFLGHGLVNAEKAVAAVEQMQR